MKIFALKKKWPVTVGIFILALLMWFYFQSQKQGVVTRESGPELNLLHQACSNLECTDTVPFNSMYWSLDDVRKVIYKFPALETIYSSERFTSWTVDEARKEAIDNAQQEISLKFFPSVDPDLIVNQQLAKKGGGKLKDREIWPIGKSYGVSYYKNRIDYQYASDGTLMAVRFMPDFSTSKNSYWNGTIYSYVVGNGLASAGYKSGSLFKITIVEDGFEKYTFTPSGKLFKLFEIDRKSGNLITGNTLWNMDSE